MMLRSGLLYGSGKVCAGRAACGLVSMLLSLGMASCGVFSPPPPPEPPAEPATPDTRWQQEAERLEKLLAEKEVEKEFQQQEIERLEKLLTEKEGKIRTQQVRQKDQAKTLKETSSQAVHAQVKLRRLATRPAAASTIAEAEVAMEALRASPLTASEQGIQALAQYFLSMAAAAYAQDNHVAAVEHAAHARGFIDMLKSNRVSRTSDAHRAATPFEAPIPLRTAVNTNLRQAPSLGAAILVVLKRNVAVTAEAYQGDWLQVQAADGQSGWVLGTLVEPPETER